MIELRRVSRVWRLDAVEVPALVDVDARFEPGEATVLMGPSGSGKSTLLQVAALLDAPSSGEVWFEGRCVSALSDDARSDLRLRRIGFVHQTYPMITMLTPLENIALPARYVGGAGPRARELLDRVGLADLADRDVRTLSGGQRQRVAIARALVNRPAVVYADEPTAALDPKNGAQVLDLLIEATRAEGAALVLATHDASIAARADRVLRLDGGRVVAEERP